MQNNNELETYHLLVVGSRDFEDYELLDKVLKEEIKDAQKVEIVSGGARGADALAKRFALEHHLDYKEFEADWNTYGKAAGYRRNYLMHAYLSQFEKRKCIAFWNGESHGTKHSFKLSEDFNTPLKVINY